MNEIFKGNAYIYSAYTISEVDILKKIKVTHNKEILNYLEYFNNTIHEEVKFNSINSLTRIYLEKISISYLDAKETEELKIIDTDLILTYDTQSNLSLITMVFFNIEMPISHLLDRMSQNRFQIIKNNILINLNEYLEKKYSLISLNFSKACLTTNTEINQTFYPYYMANETYDSQFMSAKIKEELYGKNSLINIAQYESSDIYSGRNTIIRIDKRDYEKSKISRIQSDIIFLFILEILMFKEASIEKTNKKVITYLSKNKEIQLKKLDEINKEYSQTIHFWDINIFNYITAQNLADNIEKAFHITKKISSFKENQSLLEHKINIKQAIAQEYESKILFTIAVILFVFEIFKTTKEFMKISNSIACSSATLLIIIIFILIKRKKNNE